MNKTGTNTTLLNASKQARLTKEHVLPKHITTHPASAAFLASLLKLDASKEAILYSMGKQLLGKTRNRFALALLGEYECEPVVFEQPLPQEFDLLGAAYQYLNTKAENLVYGSFYTSYGLARDMVGQYSFANGETLIDLACGSGVFLFASDAPQEQLYGVDFDPLAVMIAKFNFFVKFPDAHMAPQIWHADFLDWYAAHHTDRYTYVVGNPPYGANLDKAKLRSNHIVSGESFSYFVEFGFDLLEARGRLSYLVPEALLNVKRHQDVRDFLLDHAHVARVEHYTTRFSGVMTDIWRLDVDRTQSGETLVVAGGKETILDQQAFKSLKNHIFAVLTPEAQGIVAKVRGRSTTDLKASTFGLGVVTGDNVGKLLPAPAGNTEPIFTGKEVKAYAFTPVKKHIVFDRAQLQQVAPDAVYRAPVKLVYKTISKRLKVALDFEQRLTTASANIIVPQVTNNTPYSLALLLNSELYSFLNQKLHGTTNKISRENLEALPLPAFTAAELRTIEVLVRGHLRGETPATTLQAWVDDYFDLTPQERQHVRENLA